MIIVLLLKCIMLLLRTSVNKVGASVARGVTVAQALLVHGAAEEACPAIVSDKTAATHVGLSGLHVLETWDRILAAVVIHERCCFVGSGGATLT